MRDDVLATARILRTTPFGLRPDADARAALAEALGIRTIRKLSLEGEIAPENDADLRLEAMLGATVVQDCVVTGAPVTTRIDVPVVRRYLADWQEPDGDEVEMPEDDSAEAMPEVVDLASVMAEALALALPDWPRAPGVERVDVTVTEPGKTPMTEEEAKPFAGLKALKDRLSGEDED